MTFSSMPLTEVCASSATTPSASEVYAHKFVLAKLHKFHSPNCRSSSSSITSSSSRAAIRFFKLSYIAAGSTGVSVFFLPFCPGDTPFTRFGVWGCGWEWGCGCWYGYGCKFELEVEMELLDGGLGGIDPGAGGAGPGGGGLGTLMPAFGFTLAFAYAPLPGLLLLFELAPFMTISPTAPVCFEVVRAQQKQSVKNPMFSVLRGRGLGWELQCGRGLAGRLWWTSCSSVDQPTETGIHSIPETALNKL